MWVRAVFSFLMPASELMIINGKEVKQTSTDKGTEYEYFACQCQNENKAFLDELLDKHRDKTQGKGDYLTTSLIAALNCESWYVTMIFADQWAVITLANEDHGDTMRIPCDIVEHGLAIAVLIAESLSVE